MATSADERLAYGVAVPDGDRQVLRFERRLAHPIDRVWAALTDPEQLRNWLGVADELELRDGGAVVIRWLNTDEEGNGVILHGTVTAVDPPNLLEYDSDPHGVLRFELRPDGDTTLLTFSSSITHPAEWWAKLLAGWHMHLEFLDGVLTGEKFDLVNLPMEHWEALYQEYQRRLG